MTTNRSITIITLLFSLVLPLSVHAWGPDGISPEAYLKSLTEEGERMARNLPGFATASPEQQQRRFEEAVRVKIISAFQKKTGCQSDGGRPDH